MRKLIYLLIILGAGYYFYTNSESLWKQVQPYEAEIFNITPPKLRSLLFSTEVPTNFRGTYELDAPATMHWVRHQPYEKQPESSGRRQIELRGKNMVSLIKGANVSEGIEVVEKGDGFIVVEYADKPDTKSRIEQERNGVWIYYDEIAPGYKERYRKVK